MKTEIAIPTYNLFLDIYYEKNEKAANKRHRKIMSNFGCETRERHDARASAYSIYIDKKGYVRQAVLIREDKNPQVDVYAHEALHCVFNIMNRCGIDYCYKSEEAFTYLIGFITQCIYDTVNEIKGKKS